MHSPYILGFELLEGLIFFLCLRHAYRTGSGSLSRLMSGAIFGLALEAITIYQLRAYEYGDFSFMVFEVPVAIGIAWGNQLYGARLFSDASSLPGWARPILDAVLVIYLDLLVEPVATRLGFWDFHVPPTFEWFGTPYTNFWGFFWVVASFSGILRFFERSARGAGKHLAGPGAIVAAAFVTLAANAVLTFGVQGAARNIAVAAILLLAVGSILALRVRLVHAPPAIGWQFALSSMVFFLGIGLVSGVILGPPALLVTCLLVSAGGALAYFGGRRLAASEASAQPLGLTGPSRKGHQ